MRPQRLSGTFSVHMVRKREEKVSLRTRPAASWMKVHLLPVQTVFTFLYDLAKTQWPVAPPKICFHLVLFMKHHHHWRRQQVTVDWEQQTLRSSQNLSTSQPDELDHPSEEQSQDKNLARLRLQNKVKSETAVHRDLSPPQHLGRSCWSGLGEVDSVFVTSMLGGHSTGWMHFTLFQFDTVKSSCIQSSSVSTVHLHNPGISSYESNAESFSAHV